MNALKSILLAAALLLVGSANLQATEALIFDGGGYNIHILVGLLDNPVVAEVRFTSPGAKEWISIPRDLVKVEKFDFKKRVLVMRFSNQNKPDLPASFSLTVKKENAVLATKSKKIKSTFNWEI